jgi:hypothetical protein
MVSKARLDFPEPERPVTTISRSRGISTSMFLRLWTRAPRTTSLSSDDRDADFAGTGELMVVDVGKIGLDNQYNRSRGANARNGGRNNPAAAQCCPDRPAQGAGAWYAVSSGRS